MRHGPQPCPGPRLGLQHKAPLGQVVPRGSGGELGMVVTPGQNWTQKHMFTKSRAPPASFCGRKRTHRREGPAGGRGAGTHRMAFRLRSMASGGIRLLAA